MAVQQGHNEWKNSQVWTAHEQAVHSVSWSEEAELIATASSDKSVKVWREQEEVARLEGHKELVRDVAWHPLRTCLASGSQVRSV